jgi:flagellar basal body-associated protein FliL
MDDHIPVRPMTNKTKSQFSKSREPEVDEMPKKKIDIRDIDAQKTEEEKKNPPDRSRWIVIVLVIVVIVLLLACIYLLVFKPNQDPITYNLQRPMFMNRQPQPQQQSQASPAQPPQNQANFHDLDNTLEKAKAQVKEHDERNISSILDEVEDVVTEENDESDSKESEDILEFHSELLENN